MFRILHSFPFLCRGFHAQKNLSVSAAVAPPASSTLASMRASGGFSKVLPDRLQNSLIAFQTASISPESNSFWEASVCLWDSSAHKRRP